MAYFCHQVSFTTSAWTRVLQNTEDRFHAVRVPIESLGGKVLGAFFAIDSYDVLLLSELPEDVTSGAVDLALFAGGDVAHIHSTRLLSASQVLEAAKKPGAYPDRPVLRALAASAG